MPFAGRNLSRFDALGGHDPGCGTCDQEAPVRVGLREGRAEVAVAHRERLRQAVVEGDVGLVPVAHGYGPAGADEAVVATVVERVVARNPVLPGRPVELARRGHVEGAQEPSVLHGVRVEGPAVAVEREPVAAAEHPEARVEGVVLHHHNDDVFDLGQCVGAFGQVRVRPRPGLAHHLRDRRRRRRRRGRVARGRGRRRRRRRLGRRRTARELCDRDARAGDGHSLQQRTSADRRAQPRRVEIRFLA